MDIILIKNLRITAIIGIHAYERITPQEILINISLSTDTRHAAQTDDINDCIDYSIIADKVKAHAETSKRLTVEALAEDIAKICLQVPGVQAARIRVEKTQAIPHTDSVGVEIERGNI